MSAQLIPSLLQGPLNIDFRLRLLRALHTLFEAIHSTRVWTWRSQVPVPIHLAIAQAPLVSRCRLCALA